MGPFYVHWTPNIVDPFYVLSTMGPSYVHQTHNIMGLFYVLPRPLYIRRTHNSMTSLYGSFLCVITDDYSTHALEASPIVHKKDP